MSEHSKLETFRQLIDTLDQDSKGGTFRQEVEAFRTHPLIAPHLDGDQLDLSGLALEDIAELVGNGQTPGYYFLLAATTHNRTSIKTARKQVPGEKVTRGLQIAHVLKAAFTPTTFDAVLNRAVADRSRTLSRAKSGDFEKLFRDYLLQEGVNVTMSSDQGVVSVPGLLISKRKPDGAYPDPKGGKAPRIYLEVKNVKRVSDDIQKRLYEIAQASLEMKTLYGTLELRGLNASLEDARTKTSEYREELRKAILASPPVVVGLLLCSKAEAEPYRAGIEAFVDRVFFAREETGECVEFLKATIAKFEAASGDQSA